MFGFLNINKPSGITSHSVISVLRKITGIKQIGHGGTLDPLASGVLPAAIGKAAKLIDYLPSDKSYHAGLYFGKKSDTFDIEGQIEEISGKMVSEQEVIEILPLFRGKIKQIPPMYSAVHHNGKRLYELARKGIIPCSIPPREVTVYKNEIISFDYEKQMLKLDISCSKGTYIRTIINDMGEMLKSGAIMFELTRTSAASMKIENSLELNGNLTKDDIERNLINPADILNMRVVEINDAEYKLVMNGNKFKNTSDICAEEILLVKSGKLIALADAFNDFIHPKKVLL